MISRIAGKLIEKKDQAVVILVHGLSYDVAVPESVLARIEEALKPDGTIELVTYYYFQMTPASGNPVLIGFLNEIERDFFLQFIKVSGIGPRAAVKALNRPISEISRAIDAGDTGFLTTLPGIGNQRAREIVAKLQGKVGKFGLIQDKGMISPQQAKPDFPAWQQEALDVLLQLQYKKPEALEMIEKAVGRNPKISTGEELLNEIYKQRVR